MIMCRKKSRHARRGGVYIAVLGTSLVVALLGIAALTGQRLQNRMLSAAADMRQAELNANTAVELALLAMKQDANWRTTYTSGDWFIKRGTDAGSCTANITDPIDGDLANNANDPVLVLGIGYSGQAEQRAQVTVDPVKQPLSSLRSAIAAGDLIDLQGGDVLRTGGLITASQTSSSASNVYGAVEAISVSGSTYNGTTTQVTAARRPAMPDWTSVFNYYKTNGTALDITQFPQQTPNLGRNTSFDSDTSYWTGTATGLPTCELERNTGVNGHAACCRVKNRNATTAGPSQYIDQIVKPGGSYNITIQIMPNSSWGNWFRVKLATKGTGAVQTSSSSAISLSSGSWQDMSVTLTAPTWSGALEYARVTIDTEHSSGSTNDFYIDNLDIRENVTGRFIYRQLLGPSVNTLYSGAPTNPQGIYWINCAGSKLIIERSRIVGTLLVTNPGAGSCVSNGPINWTPAVAGYPALLVDADVPENADFAINATNRSLSEVNNQVNFNPVGASYEFSNPLYSSTDSSANDIYPSEIRGLVAVRDDLTYANRTLIRGQVLVGDDISNSSGELEVNFQPDSLLNPPPGFTAPYVFQRRPVSIQKVVLP
jgi:hypothetical protein